MLTYLRPAVSLTLAFTLFMGFAYPLAVTGAAQALFPAAAEGNLIDEDGTVLGSALIAQPFAGPGYLHPRPSASGWNAAGTGASNLGPTSAALVAEVFARRAAWEAANGVPAPIDAVTASGSGLDPHVSPETAFAQVARIAAARSADPAEVRDIVAAAVEGPLLGLYGEPRLNVLLANLALDARLPIPPAGKDRTASE